MTLNEVKGNQSVHPFPASSSRLRIDTSPERPKADKTIPLRKEVNLTLILPFSLQREKGLPHSELAPIRITGGDARAPRPRSRTKMSVSP